MLFVDQCDAAGWCLPSKLREICGEVPQQSELGGFLARMVSRAISLIEYLADAEECEPSLIDGIWDAVCFQANVAVNC